jgi:hypothetical protein
VAQQKNVVLAKDMQERIHKRETDTLTWEQHEKKEARNAGHVIIIMLMEISTIRLSLNLLSFRNKVIFK